MLCHAIYCNSKATGVTKRVKNYNLLPLYVAYCHSCFLLMATNHPELIIGFIPFDNSEMGLSLFYEQDEEKECQDFLEEVWSKGHK